MRFFRLRKLILSFSLYLSDTYVQQQHKWAYWVAEQSLGKPSLVSGAFLISKKVRKISPKKRRIFFESPLPTSDCFPKWKENKMIFEHLFGLLLKAPMRVPVFYFSPSKRGFLV